MSPDKLLDSLLVGFPVEAAISIKQQYVVRSVFRYPVHTTIGASIGNVAGIMRHLNTLDLAEEVVQGALNAKHTGRVDWGTGSDRSVFFRGPRYRVDFSAIETARRQQRQEDLLAEALEEAHRDADRQIIDNILAVANL